MFTINYTLCRVLLYPFGMSKLIKSFIWGYDNMSTLRIVLSITAFIFYSAMYALQLYWYFLILKSFAVMVGIIKKKPRKPKVAEDDKKSK